jgi:inosine-uridine nucleoside N-ribohydrolase
MAERTMAERTMAERTMAERTMAERARTRVVIDCDTGVDDAMAVLYGLLAPEIEIVGLTCCWGNIWVETATANTLRLLEIVDRPEVPVAMGARKPLLGPLWELSHGVHGADGQGNTDLPPPKLRPVPESAAELIVRLAHEHPGELTLATDSRLARVDVELTVADLRVYAPKENANAHVVLDVDAPRFVARWMEVITHHPSPRPD